MHLYAQPTQIREASTSGLRDDLHGSILSSGWKAQYKGGVQEVHEGSLCLCGLLGSHQIINSAAKLNMSQNPGSTLNSRNSCPRFGTCQTEQLLPTTLRAPSMKTEGKCRSCKAGHKASSNPPPPTPAGMHTSYRSSSGVL